MVYQYCYVMAFIYIFAHTGILRRKRRGIQPKEIDAALWDEQIELDAKSGKLDHLAEKAIQDFDSGKCKELRTISDRYLSPIER